MEQTKTNGKIVRRLNNNVQFKKIDQIIITDNAVQYIDEDILYMNGNTIMIKGLDTLTCDSMVYWSKLDSGYARGKVNYTQFQNNRSLMTEIFHYWQTDGYRGTSFNARGNTLIKEKDKIIKANEVSYDDNSQIMILNNNASIESVSRGMFGDNMVIQYKDSLIEKIKVTNNAFSFNDSQLKINEDEPYHIFRDEMSSKQMIAIFSDGDIVNLELNDMAKTLYHVVDNGLLVGKNETTGDSILVNFKIGNINRIQVTGGALGEFVPERQNSKVDTTIFYGAEYIDYHIDNEETLLSNNAYVEYQNTKLDAGEIIVDWQTNILNAVEINNKYPMVRSSGEEPMVGNSMVFDLLAKHGRIIKGRTSYNEGFYHGKEVFRDDPNIFHIQRSKYTSCELENPHFYLGSRKMKMLPGDRVIAKPLWLYIYDFPVIGIPLAVFPNKGGRRHSGWIMPSFDSYTSIGTGFRNLGYYWAPNDYMDAKTVINFFDKEGFNINSKLKYIRKNGSKWYNYNLNGDLSGTFKRRIQTDEIMDIIDRAFVTENKKISWKHNQKFDPTQRMAIRYEYISSKDAYQNNQEVSLANRLKQNLSSSLNYNKNWQTNSTSLSIGISQFRDLAIENKLPISAGYLNDGRYKSYKYADGPRVNFRTGSRKLFGIGEAWYNSFSVSYNMNASLGRRNYSLIKQTDSTWAENDTTQLKHGGFKHSAKITTSNTYFSWLTISPTFLLMEDWLFNYKSKISNNEGSIIKDNNEFKRRFTWSSSINAKTKIYGLFPFNLGSLNAIRHVMTPSVSFTYQPDFSDPQYGGNNYFQKLEDGKSFDYFTSSYVGGTSNQEKQTYRIKLVNDFQLKIKNAKEDYTKLNFLNITSSLSYNSIKNEFKFSNLTSSIRTKSFSGGELFTINMLHDLYKRKNGERIDQLLDFNKGEIPRLKKMDIRTNMNFVLFGKPTSGGVTKNESNISSSDLYANYNEFESDTKSKIQKNSDNLWESNLRFNYSADWEESNKEWEYRFSLKSSHLIKLSNNWTLSYEADFNIKEREMTYHMFRFYRPLHCWEFSFNYFPRGLSSGFSLQINVKNPDLRDLKLTSKSSNRGFVGY